MSYHDWMRDANATPIVSVAERLGLRPRARRMTCPCCAHPRASLHGSSRGDRWTCHACGEWGDVVDLVARVATGARMSANSAPELRAWFRGEVEVLADAPQIAEPEYPPRADIVAAIKGASPISPETAEGRWVRSRIGVDIAGLGLAGALGHRAWPWARIGARTWLETGHTILIPMVDAAGATRSIRCRSWRADARPKAAPPTGHSASGLVMANPRARSLLRGGASGDLVVVVEGEPAWLAVAVACPDVAVLGIVSGSWTPAHGQAVAGRDVLVITDHDKAGDAYFDRVLSCGPARRAAFCSPDEIALAEGMGALRRKICD